VGGGITRIVGVFKPVGTHLLTADEWCINGVTESETKLFQLKQAPRGSLTWIQAIQRAKPIGNFLVGTAVSNHPTSLRKPTDRRILDWVSA
jgi:hypothetical protein